MTQLCVKLPDGGFVHLTFRSQNVTIRKFVKNSEGRFVSHAENVEWDKIIDAIEGQKNFLP